MYYMISNILVDLANSNKRFFTREFEDVCSYAYQDCYVIDYTDLVLEKVPYEDFMEFALTHSDEILNMHETDYSGIVFPTKVSNGAIFGFGDFTVDLFNDALRIYTNMAGGVTTIRFYDRLYKFIVSKRSIEVRADSDVLSLEITPPFPRYNMEALWVAWVYVSHPYYIIRFCIDYNLVNSDLSLYGVFDKSGKLLNVLSDGGIKIKKPLFKIDPKMLLFKKLMF